MIAYAVLMFALALVFLGIGIAIYRGKTDLIHEYHQENVTDKAGYGKAMGKALMGIAAAMVLSGGIGLCGTSEILTHISAASLLAGLFCDVLVIVYIQKKYNGGLF